MSFLGKVFGKGGTAVDPVCKMQVSTSKPPGGTAVHEGTTYYFCAAGCKRAFEKDPAQFLSGGGSQEGMGHGHH